MLVAAPERVSVSRAVSSVWLAFEAVRLLGGVERGSTDRPCNISHRGGSAGAFTFFNIVFFVVLLSSRVQGPTINRVAERLRIGVREEPRDE
jgi:hypothetical protein